MLKRFLLMILSLCMAFVMVGCGNSVKGLWMTKEISNFDKSEIISLLDIDTADNGDYLIKHRARHFRHISTPNSNKVTATASITTDDEILNEAETITYVPGSWGQYTWNGQDVKIAVRFKWEVDDAKNTVRVPKQDIAIKDGKLVYYGKTYTKIDQKELEKMKEDWKNRLKSHLGQKVRRLVHGCGYVQARISKVIIIDNGKETVYEEGKADGTVTQTEKQNGKQDAKKQAMPANNESGKTGVITGTEVRFRKSPDGQIMDHFQKGESVTVLGKEGNWYKVRRGNGTEGYVSADYCN